jgi:long-chain fatty acid transport protein
LKNLTHQVIGTLVLSVLIVCIALGGGYQLNEQGARAVGMGGAFVARADDPSAIFFNPAGLASQNGINILAGGNLIMPSTDFTPHGSSTKYSTESQVFTPINLYGTYRIDDKIVVGLGIFNPFGLGTKWPSAMQSLNASLQTWYFNPAIGYKIDDQFSVGLGISLVYSSIKQTQTSVSLDGTGSGFNLNLGVTYKALDNLSIGLSYRIKTDVDLSGNFSAGYGTVTAKETLPMPGSFTLGAAF